ncbi:hypothetical protein S7711_06304 [Stachybotrys chartarum IBT 7711]|uniref:alpha-1,2-Mannosidase n=1 Tax=Stachybotrys chartarum (strain CBS 109288 / IBT 7711) TaxID=1280523 RepID=A0A084B849_STACB|nr:hypothetical protein S7711_06304 [Stachybotrys chartarum IBT 7711]
MISHLRGRTSLRFVAILAVLSTTYLVWRGFYDPAIAVSFESEINYIPSSYDWSKVKVYHPAGDIKSPPTGAIVAFPRVQAETLVWHRSDEVWQARKNIVKSKFVKSWEAYKTHAWTKDELMPLSGKGKQTFGGWSTQVVDALDTLWIMNLRDDYRMALRHVATIDWSKTGSREIDLFEVTIRYLGGLIGAYELSSDLELLAKSMELGDAIYAAFDTPNRLPARWLDYGKAKRGQQLADVRAPIATVGTLSLELTRLSQLTGDPKYYDAADRVKQFFRQFQNETLIPGLWPQVVNCRNETMDYRVFTLGAGSDSVYEYLPKMHALLGGRDPEYEHMTVQALDALRDNVLFRPMTPSDEDILLAGNAVNRDGKTSLVPEMQHLTCFAGGMYGLAGKLLARHDYVTLGYRLAAGCVWAYDAFETNIMPEISQLVACDSLVGPCKWTGDAVSRGRGPELPDGFVRVREPGYSLRPEAIESVFYMWRITGDEVWRDAAWRMWEGIAQETETELAFASIEDVRQHGSSKTDTMDTFWLSETLKYFYLIFEDPSVISLDEWVLNSEGHPFRRPI